MENKLSTSLEKLPAKSFKKMREKTMISLAHIAEQKQIPIPKQSVWYFLYLVCAEKGVDF